jgi:hypothetical protein
MINAKRQEGGRDGTVDQVGRTDRERGPQSARPPPPRVALDRRHHRIDIEDPRHLGFVHRALEHARSDTTREIEQRAPNRRRRASTERVGCPTAKTAGCTRCSRPAATR